MKFPAVMTVEAAEAFLATLGTTDDPDLVIPRVQSRGSLGGEAAMAQALVTWAASSQAGSLRLTPPPDAQERGLIELMALTLPYDIRTLEGTPIPPSNALRDVTESLSALDRPLSATTLPTGPRLTFLCADHLAMGHPRALYNLDAGGAPEPSERKFDALATLIRTRLMEGETVHPDLLPTLAFCAFELFTNTHDHARSGLHDDRAGTPAGAAPAISLRGITVRKLGVGEADVARMAGGSSPFSGYLTRAMADRGRRKQRWFMEVSVFDSGPGYASRLKNAPLEELTDDDERQAVRRCFLKHVGTKDRAGKGIGLTDTGEQIAAARGFFRLRTGRLSVCAALDGGLATYDAAHPPLVDWNSGDAEFTPKAPAVGTLFSLVLPLMEAHENDIQLPF